MEDIPRFAASVGTNEQITVKVDTELKRLYVRLTRDKRVRVGEIIRRFLREELPRLDAEVKS